MHFTNIFEKKFCNKMLLFKSFHIRQVTVPRFVVLSRGQRPNAKGLGQLQ